MKKEKEIITELPIDYDKVGRLPVATRKNVETPSVWKNSAYAQVFPRSKDMYGYDEQRKNMVKFRRSRTRGLTAEGCLLILAIFLVKVAIYGLVVTLAWNIIGPMIVQGAYQIDYWMGCLIGIFIAFFV